MSSPRRLHAVVLTAFAVAFVVGSVGCGSPEKSEITVARVGSREIKLDYFERKMNTMDPQFVPPDIDTQSGREELLEVMINKEVMALKAEDLGMGADGEVNVQADAIARLAAVNKMRDDVVASAQNPTEDQIFDYYEKLPRELSVSYMLFDYEHEAADARTLVEGGEVWPDVAKRLDAGDPGGSGNYSLTMKYGTIADDFERAVFDLPVGEISEPLDSIYGWFLIRVDDVTLRRVQALDDLRGKVIESVIKQDSALLTLDFIIKIFDEYNFTLDNEVLKLIWEALPEDSPLDPPPPKNQLPNLVIDSVHLDKVLMSYSDVVWTVRKYVDFYDESSVFGRPRRERRVGAMRRALKEQVIRELMPLAAQDRGYMDAPEVRDEFKNRLEQGMVMRLHEELIAGAVDVSIEEIESYWADHASDFYSPESRELLAIVASTEADAVAARIDAQGGVSWKEIVERYCIDSDIKQKQGRFGTIGENAESPFRDIAFQLGAEGDVSMPTEVGPDQWAVVKLARVFERKEPELEDIRAQVGMRVKSMKEEAYFQERVTEWRAEYGVETFPKELMKAVYAPIQRNTRIPITVGGGSF